MKAKSRDLAIVKMSEGDVENGETAGLISQRDRNVRIDPKICDTDIANRVSLLLFCYYFSNRV